MANVEKIPIKASGNAGKKILDYFARERWVIPLTLVALYAIIFTIVYPDVFASMANISSLLLEFSLPAIIAIGMAILLIGGEIDLSVGYNVMFSNILAGTLIVMGVPVALAIIITIITATLMGLVVGLLVSRIGVNSFIATLGSGLIFYGLSQFIYSLIYGVNNHGIDIQHLPTGFTAIGKTEFLGIQLPVFYAIILLAVFAYLMAKTTYFRKYYYIGMNKEAAQLSGINVKSMKTVAFIISAALASLAGVLMASRMGSAATTFGKGMELNVITAVVIGGVSMKGGQGSMLGAILGSLFIVCLSNGLRIAEADSTLYKIIQGAVLLGAVILDAQFSKRKIVG